MRKHAPFALLETKYSYIMKLSSTTKETEKMYVNERDQINYHGFLRALREMNNVSQEKVCKGICTRSGMNRFENGNRLAEKLMRDRLTSRLGIAGEKYEDYLQPKEYVRWEHRLRIVKAIEKKDISTAKKELESYENVPRQNGINKQFVEAMRYMILCYEGAPVEQLRECMHTAIKYTVPSINKALDGAQLLADQEINLIAEKMRLAEPKKVIRDVRAWRIGEYEKLLEYIDNSCWQRLQKAKVYTKIAFYICNELLDGEISEVECRYGLELCSRAIDLLRDTRRIYYFIELAESRCKFIEYILVGNIQIDEKNKLQEILIENNNWIDVFKELYAEHKIQPYMSNFCYLYYETECYDMVKVIEVRRNMLGLSRVRLGEGICTEKTIIRFEREGRNPSVDLVRLLFERMGMCAEYRRAPIITTDANALAIYRNLTRLVNGNNFEEALECLETIKSKIMMSIPHNRQELDRVYGYIMYKCKKINANDFGNKIMEALKETVDVSVLEKDGEKYFTRAELACIQDFAFDINTEVSTYSLEIIRDICEKKEILESEIAQLFKYELLMGRLASQLGNEKKYRESTEMSSFIMKECLLHYRASNLWDNVYNEIWNYQQQKAGNDADNSIIENKMNMCITLSQYIKEYNIAAFFQKKLNRS